MKFKLLENELEDRHKKHSKKQKGLSSFCYMGDPQKSIDMFNNSVAADASAPTGGEAGMGEALEMHKFTYSGPVFRFGKVYATEKDIFTMAVSIPAADRNICKKLKDKYGFEKTANLSIDRSAIVQLPDANKSVPQKRKKYSVNINEDDGTVEILHDGKVVVTYPSIEAAEEVLSSLEV